MKTTYYINDGMPVIFRATTKIAREKFARRCFSYKVRAISPKVAKCYISSGYEYVKVKDIM